MWRRYGRKKGSRVLIPLSALNGASIGYNHHKELGGITIRHLNFYNAATPAKQAWALNLRARLKGLNGGYKAARNSVITH
tara:strand:+ start:35966 stop:36205 length:240 start_codon:yes stop_codon:yes gene_type:complete